jgi:hypothetical protein
MVRWFELVRWFDLEWLSCQIDCKGLGKRIVCSDGDVEAGVRFGRVSGDVFDRPLLSQAADEHVPVLTESNFEDYISKDKGVLMEF